MNKLLFVKIIVCFLTILLVFGAFTALGTIYKKVNSKPKETNINLNLPKTSYLQNYKIEKNDILLAMSGATVGKVGYVDDVPLNKAYINQRVGIYRVKETPKFFFYLFSQPSYIEYALLNASGSAQPNISTESAKNFFVPIPPLDERERICQYLEKKCSYIEGIIVEKQSLISDLESYKKSLIFEVVTGKRKVV